MTPDSPIELVLQRLPGAIKNGRGWKAKCPAHEDQHPSLKLDVGEDGTVLVHCHAGCQTIDVLAKIGLDLRDLYPHDATHRVGEAPSGRQAPGPGDSAGRIGPIVAVYPYPDADGTVRRRVTKHAPKTFRPWHVNEQGQWNLGDGGLPPIPYLLPQLVAGADAAPVYVCEGEKDADALAALGLLATTNAGGAGKWRAAHSLYLHGRNVVLLPDNDEAGRDHAEKAAASLAKVATSVKVVTLPGLEPKEDVSDWITRGGTASALGRMADTAPPWSGASPVFEDRADFADASEPWEEPTPLPEGDRPPFPSALLPESLGSFVEALAVATQTPDALPALMTIASLAAAAAKRVAVLVRPGWREPVNVYALVALDSGNRKSAVVRAVANPLRAYQRTQAKEATVEIAQAESRRRIAEKALERAERGAATAEGDEARRYEAAATQLAKDLIDSKNLAVPRPPRLLGEDITPERLAGLMAEHGGRMAVISAEGGIFDVMSGRFSKDGKSPNLDLFLKAHAGDDLPVDRVGRQGCRLTAPALTLGIATQRYVMQGLMARPGFRGTGQLARLLYGVPESTVGQRTINPPPVPEGVERAYAEAITAILELPGEVEEDGTPRPHDLSLSPDATARFLRFETALEPRLGRDGDLGHVADWGAKLAGLVARLAGLFHTIEHAAGDQRPWEVSIPVHTVDAAVSIAETFLIPHALTAFGEMGADPALENARTVLRAVQRWDKPTFSRRDLHQSSLKRRFDKPDDLDRPLALLVEYGYVRLCPPPDGVKTRGRRPSNHYEINPFSRSQNPQCPQKSDPPAHFADYEDFENGFPSRDGEASGEEWRWTA